MSQQRILSGIQPTGALHLGNYLGAVQQWIDLQHSYDSYFCVVDMHAITVRQNPEELRRNTLQVAASYLATGLDPKTATIFVQSEVMEHASLSWVLSTFTQMGELERMTQYKDKVRKGKAANLGLFTYPVLMAADILLYQPELVPVGDDQKQHVELTRNIAERFNNHYEQEVFTIPDVFFPEAGARIMGLDDASNKMSKSADSAMNFISFDDDADTLRKKIMKAKTDAKATVQVDKAQPEISNLVTIYSQLSGMTAEEVAEEFRGRGYGDFKKELAEVVVSWLEPIQKEIAMYMDDPSQLEAILKDGRERAQATATETLKKVYDVVGLGY